MQGNNTWNNRCAGMPHQRPCLFALLSSPGGTVDSLRKRACSQTLRIPCGSDGGGRDAGECFGVCDDNICQCHSPALGSETPAQDPRGGQRAQSPHALRPALPYVASASAIRSVRAFAVDVGFEMR